MLARTYLTAEALGIPEHERGALIATLHALERGEVKEHTFDMNFFYGSCGTPSCLAGWAHHLSQGEAFPELNCCVDTRCGAWSSNPLMTLQRRLPAQLLQLFGLGGEAVHDDTPQRATAALSSYLTTGVSGW
jgi:hypothetical protein